MIRLLNSERVPSWLKWVLLIVTIITLVYWVLWLVFQILKYLRIFLHWATEERNYWTFIVCILIVVVGSLIAAQFFLELDPFGKLADELKKYWDLLKV